GGARAGHQRPARFRLAESEKRHHRLDRNQPRHQGLTRGPADMATATASKTARKRGASRASVKQATIYQWVALDKRGHKMKGEMAGKNAALVKAELRSQGMNPQTVKEKPKPLFGSSGKRVTPRDVAIF